MATTTTLTRIKHVQGNVLRLAIPLTLRTVTLSNGEVTTTDSDFVPNGIVRVLFGQTSRHFEYIASIRNGNVAVVEDKGTLPVGTFAITVLCNDDNGNPMRFKQVAVVQVFDVTRDAGIDIGIEFESQEWLLDGAVFIAVKGEDGTTPHIGENGHWFIGNVDTNVMAAGVGIEEITVDETSVEGEYNTVTIKLTNGDATQIHIKNGSTGEPILPNDVVRDNNYTHTDNNYTLIDKDRVSTIPYLFGAVRYDTLSRRINFFPPNNLSTPLAYIDATPFVKDGLINQISVQGGYLVLKYNSDANRSDLRLDLKYIFDSSLYLTEEEVTIELNKKADINDENRIDYSTLPRFVLDSINFNNNGMMPAQSIDGTTRHCIDGYIRKFIMQGLTFKSIQYIPDEGTLYYNKADSKFYTWDGSAMVEQNIAGASGGGGYNVSYSNGVLTFSGSNQPTYENGVLTL